MLRDNEYYKSKITFFGKILFNTKIVYLYANGDTIGFLWNYWNPLSLIIMPIVFMINILIEGIHTTLKYKHDIGIGIDPYFKKYPEKLVWIK